jgi:hypothetical protein
VRDTGDQMPCTKPQRIRSFFALTLFSVAFAFWNPQKSFAQEPPTSVPAGGLPSSAGAIPYAGWLLFPSLTQFSQYSNNYFMSPMAKIAGWGFGVSPALTAQWSNGIHTTTLFGTFTHIDYPTQNEINTDDGEVTFTQKYAPLRDLTFTFLGDYTHKTIANSLNSSIPSAISTPSTTFLPNGNEVLPNGTIINPVTGAVVGQTTPGLFVNGQTVVNPNDQYTATARVDKQFGGQGIISLSDTLQRTDYEKNASQNYSSNTVSENGSFWLGSVFYVNTNGSFTTIAGTTGPDLNVYRVTGGIGTRQVGLWRVSGYAGYQGAMSDGTSPSGGEVAGGTLTYYVTPLWTLTANFDETVNRASSGGTSNFAISTPVPTALQIPITSSTQIASATLRSDYKIAQQWLLSATFGYTHSQFLGSHAYDDAWLTDLILRYDIWRDLTLSWEYRYSSIVSNIPGSTAASNFVTMSAQYKF